MSKSTISAFVFALFMWVLVAALAAFVVPTDGVHKWEERVFWTIVLLWLPATLLVAWVDERRRR